MIKAIIFDMDGLLVDSEPLYAEAYAHAFSAFGYRLEKSVFFDYWTSRGGSVENFLKERGLDLDPKKLREIKRKWYADNYERLLKPMKGARECVKRLSIFPLALCTTSPIHEVSKGLDILGVKGLFRVLVTAEDTKRRKPDPEGFIIAARKLGFSPEECLVIEDAEKGVLAAKAAGMKAIAVPNRYTESGDFSRADLVVKDLDQLDIGIVKGM
jgi:HAD superfamily hydrolase (TIGR01509 family)